MRKPAGKPGKVVVVELAATCLTPEQVTEKARQLKAVVVDAIQPTDVRDMMRSLMARAGNGEHKAIELVLNLIGANQPPDAGPAPPPPGVAVQVNNNFGGAAPADDGRALALKVLAERGTAPAAVLEDRCNLPPGAVEEMAAEGLIRLTAKGAKLTAAGRRKASVA